jgi:hypothetical protein
MAESAAKVMTPLLVLGVTCRPDQVAIALLSSLIQHSRGGDASRLSTGAQVLRLRDIVLGGITLDPSLELTSITRRNDLDLRDPHRRSPT